MHIINARLRNQEGLHELHLEDGLIRSIARQTEAPTLGPEDLDAGAIWWYRPSSSRTFTSTPSPTAHREAETAKAHRG